MKNLKIVVVMPAYNAAKTLEKTYQEIPKEYIDEIILVDDASKDETVRIAKELNLKIIQHTHNRGYGANQKTCYKKALEEKADIIIMLHPDYQYDPQIIPKMIEMIKNKSADVVFASRFLKDNPLKGGMPLYKYISNKFLTFLENLVLKTNYSELHTGYRAYKREVLEKINFESNSDDFLFDTEIIFQLHYKGYRIKEIPVKTRYDEFSSSVGLKKGIIYGIGTIFTILKYLLHKYKIKRFKIFE